MNPRQESYTPGEIHFYSTRATPGCSTDERGGKRVSWFKKNRVLAMSLGNLILLVPMVFFFYFFLLRQADNVEAKSLGGLVLNLGCQILDQEVISELSVGFSPGAVIKAGNFSAEIFM